jgi:hypothetical protein
MLWGSRVVTIMADERRGRRAIARVTTRLLPLFTDEGAARFARRRRRRREPALDDVLNRRSEGGGAASSTVEKCGPSQHGRCRSRRAVKRRLTPDRCCDVPIVAGRIASILFKRRTTAFGSVHAASRGNSSRGGKGGPSDRSRAWNLRCAGILGAGSNARVVTRQGVVLSVHAVALAITAVSD